MNNDLLTRLPLTPKVYLQKVDIVREAGLLIELDPAAYRSASFLDDRILTPSTKGAWFPLAQLAEAARRVQTLQPLHFIFHAGHVGSTLLSRLIEEVAPVLSVREPLPLRTLAELYDVQGRVESLLSEAHFDALLGVLVTLWQRGLETTRAVVIKATSSASRVSVPLLRCGRGSQAVCLNVAPEVYLATLLAGRNSALDLRGHAGVRIARLQARFSTALQPLHALTLGELAAMSWLTEALNARELARAFPDRVLNLDFDALLGDLAGEMERVLEHLQLTAEPDALGALARSPTLGRYSKAAEFEYSPQMRLKILDQSRQTNASEIRKGLAWLDNLARSEALAAEILNSTRP